MREMAFLLFLLTVVGYVSDTWPYSVDCMIFDITEGRRITGSYQTLEGLSKLACARQCFNEERCKSANFHKSARYCELTDQPVDNDEPLDGWIILSKQVCHASSTSETETFATTACGTTLEHECLHGYIYPSARITRESLYCSQLSTDTQPKPCVSGTCKDVLQDNPDATNGIYVYKDPNGNEVTIFCEFYSDHGYTFFSSVSLSNLSSLEPHYTTSEAIIRHFRSDGSQTEATMRIITRYRSQYNLTFLFSEEFDDPVANDSRKYTDAPYITLGFIPSSFGPKQGTRQGYSVDGNDVEFTNCDTNPSNSIKFFLTPLVDNTRPCCNSVVKSAWYDNAVANVVEPGRHLPVEFYFNFMVCMGGCGAFWTSDDFAMGVALGLKFSL